MIKYPKIYRLGHAEVAGILDGEILIQPKIDGANARVWLSGDGHLWCGGRNVSHSVDGTDFQGGLGAWCHANRAALVTLLTDLHTRFTNVMLIGEHMRKHTVNYGPAVLDGSIMFYDAIDMKTGALVTLDDLEHVLDEVEAYGFKCVPTLYYGKAPPVDKILEMFVGKPSVLNPDVIEEGIVIKNPQYRNAYGRQNHAKIVSEKFHEKKSVSVKQDKNSNADYRALVAQYVTPARVRKLLAANDPYNEPSLHHMKWLGKVIVADILSEEILDIATQVNVLDFRQFNKQVARKIVAVLNDLLLEQARELQ